MSLRRKSVTLTTDGAGAASTTVSLRGMAALRCIDFQIGDLSTPDIDITDEPTGTVALSVNGVAADTRYVPTILGTDNAGANVVGAAVPFVVMGGLLIAITGGGATKTGHFQILYET
jgi:hypothetical protein